MLEKNFFKLVDEYKSAKSDVESLLKDSIEMRTDLIECDDNLTEEEKKKQIESIQKENLLERKEQEKMEKEISNIVDENKPTKLNELLEDLKYELTKEKDPIKRESINKQIFTIESSIQLLPLYLYSPCLKRNILIKKYDEFVKTAQKKIGSNKIRLFTSVYDIKKNMNKIVEDRFSSKEVKKVSAFILSYICNCNFKDEKDSTFVYYMLRNFTYHEELSPDQQELFKRTLIDLNSRI